VDAADNIDLLQIVQEFEESYEVRFNRRPKLVKRLVEEVPAGGKAGRGHQHTSCRGGARWR